MVERCLLSAGFSLCSLFSFEVFYGVCFCVRVKDILLFTSCDSRLSMSAECGFETNQQLNECILRFPWSEYPLPPLHRVSRDGDILSLTYLTVQGDKLEVLRSINEQDQFLMWTPVHWAAYYGKTDCVERLVSCGLKIDTIEGRFKQTPTHLAALAGHAKLLHWLLEHGSHADMVDSLGETPVHKAARGGSTDCLSLLHTFRTSLNTFNMYQQTPYDVALSLGFEQCASFLKSHSFASGPWIGRFVFSNERKSKRIQDDKDHEPDVKRPRNIHYVDHIEVFDSNLMNHGLLNGTSTCSNGIATNKVNGENHEHENFAAEDTCSLSDNNDIEMLADEIQDSKELKYTIKYLNHPPRCLNLCGHFQ